MANKLWILFLLFLKLCSQCCLQLSVSHSIVEFLPGFQGPLPFELETGYIGVGESEDVQLFYYFVKSEGNSGKDPLLLWLTGGPGCSALSGLVFEIGPLNFQVAEYNGSTPTLVLNPYSWTKVSSIIFVDIPVGTGFSYAKTQRALQSSDSILVQQADQFLRKWLMDHPEFLSNPVYVGGDSYSGITVPAVALQISNGNEEGVKPLVALKGYLVGNGRTNQTVEDNSKIPFAHGTGLISDELYESLKRSCGGEYSIIETSNAECLKYLQDFRKCTSGINEAHILEPLCAFASPKPIEMLPIRRLRFQPSIPTVNCRTYGGLLAKYWANDKSVRKALHIRGGSIGTWLRCNNGLPYTQDFGSSTKYHAYLGTKGYPALVYSGDHDMLIPYIGTQAWIRSLNYSIVEDWRPWYLQGQVAGYTRAYSNGMTFATIKGGGHTAPEYRPPECFAMFKRWILQEPL